MRPRRPGSRRSPPRQRTSGRASVDGHEGAAVGLVLTGGYRPRAVGARRHPRGRPLRDARPRGHVRRRVGGPRPAREDPCRRPREDRADQGRSSPTTSTSTGSSPSPESRPPRNERPVRASSVIIASVESDEASAVRDPRPSCWRRRGAAFALQQATSVPGTWLMMGVYIAIAGLLVLVIGARRGDRTAITLPARRRRRGKHRRRPRLGGPRHCASAARRCWSTTVGR